jgi:lysophospholipase L1-like esterase
MHTILCYGDSNTFGTNPNGGRWDFAERWTGVLSALLGPSVHLIEEGLGGRTTVFSDPLEDMRCGKEYLPLVLHSHRPLDLVILSLGTNDCKSFFHANERIIAKALMQLGQLVRMYPYGQGYPIPRVLVMAPIYIGEAIENTQYVEFDGSSVSLSRKLGPAIKELAEQEGFLFFDASAVASASQTDQLHMDKDGHRALGEALAPVIRSLFGLQPETRVVEVAQEPAKPVHRTLRFPFLKR